MALLCVCVSGQSGRTINEVGPLYMSGMGEQISMHFETAIALRLDQMTALVDSTVTGEIHATEYEAAQAIRALEREDREVPIIAMTAGAFAEDVKRSLDSGMNAHVAKPIDVREIMRLLEKFIK